MLKYGIYIKAALGAITAMKEAVIEAKKDGEVTADEKFMIGIAFFVGLISSLTEI